MNDLLCFKEVSVHFIYSFFLDFNDYDFEKDVLSAIKQNTRNRANKEPYWSPANCHPGVPEKRKGIEPNFRSKVIKQAHLTYSDMMGEVKDQRVAISRLMRILDSGVGTLDITLTLKQNQQALAIDNVYDMLELVNELYSQEKKRTYNRIDFPTNGKTLKSCTVFDLFNNTLNGLLKIMNSAPHTQITLLDDLIADKTIGEYQHPFIVTVCTLPKASYDDIFLDNADMTSLQERKNKYKKPILSLLLRDIFPQNMPYIDQGFADKYTNSFQGLPINMNLNSTFYYTFHPRSCLIFKSNRTEDPSTFILPSLLSVIELIRVRWHSIVLINGILDLLIKEVQHCDDQSLAILDKIIDYRTKFARLLEDPTSYSWGGGSLNELYDEAVKKLWLEKLELKGLEKFRLLDNIYTDKMRKTEWLRFSKFEKILGEKSEI